MRVHRDLVEVAATDVVDPRDHVPGGRVQDHDVASIVGRLDPLADDREAQGAPDVRPVGQKISLVIEDLDPVARAAGLVTR